MRREGCYMVTEIISGSVVERRKTRIRRSPKKRGKRVKGSSSERKQVGNREYAKLQLARAINCNFCQGDLWLTLSYSREGLEKVGDDFKAADHAAGLFLDRLGRRFKKLGKEFRWIRNTSQIDGDTGEVVRLHHHLILPGGAFTVRDKCLWIGEERVEEIWGLGEIDYQIMRRQKDFKPIANYIVNQGRFLPDEKKWSCSRNLKKPIVRRRTVTSGGALRVPAGAVELPGCRYDPERGVNYVRYIKPERSGKVGGHKETAAAMERAEDAGGGDGL